MDKGTTNPPPQSPNGSPHGAGHAREGTDPPHDRATTGGVGGSGSGAGGAGGGGTAHLAKPQPKANAPAPEGGPIDLSETPMSGASGFVGILARRQPGPGDSHMPVDTAGGSTEAQARRKKYELHMAREVEAQKGLPTDGAAKKEPEPLVPPIPEPRRRTPALVLLTALLLAIGLWAAGAIFYMQRVAPSSANDIQYPLLQWAEPGIYAHQSVMLAWGLLLCLPVSIALGAVVLWRQILQGRRRV